jgi:ubiquitin carboxyl-terminal hydrolase 9/24
MQLICEIKPEIIGDVIRDHLNPMLYKVQKPKKQGFAPRHEGRSYHGYAGIKNLGSICYMIAMIQQLFHIPALRYLLLATKP